MLFLALPFLSSALGGRAGFRKARGSRESGKFFFFSLSSFRGRLFRRIFLKSTFKNKLRKILENEAQRFYMKISFQKEIL